MGMGGDGHDTHMTKEHVVEKHMFPPTEITFLPTNKLWVALDT